MAEDRLKSVYILVPVTLGIVALLGALIYLSVYIPELLRRTRRYSAMRNGLSEYPLNEDEKVEEWNRRQSMKEDKRRSQIIEARKELLRRLEVEYQMGQQKERRRSLASMRTLQKDVLGSDFGDAEVDLGELGYGMGGRGFQGPHVEKEHPPRLMGRYVKPGNSEYEVVARGSGSSEEGRFAYENEHAGYGGVQNGRYQAAPSTCKSGNRNEGEPGFLTMENGRMVEHSW